ncbi:MAG: YrdB family protein [Anaerolineae bacterium]
MSSNPINLAVRFLLEVAALLAIGYWGWSASAGLLRFVLALGLPLLAAIVWGTFRVPDDASSSGRAPVPVPGALRLLLELALFGFATWALYDTGAVWPSLILGLVVLAHYVVSYDRVAWLVRR